MPVVMTETFGAFSGNPLYNELQARKSVPVSAKVRCLYTREKIREKNVRELSAGLSRILYKCTNRSHCGLYAVCCRYEIVDVICIGGNDTLYNCFRKSAGDFAAENRLAVEEMCKLYKSWRIILPEKREKAVADATKLGKYPLSKSIKNSRNWHYSSLRTKKQRHKIGFY